MFCNLPSRKQLTTAAHDQADFYDCPERSPFRLDFRQAFGERSTLVPPFAARISVSITPSNSSRALSRCRRNRCISPATARTMRKCVR